RRGARRDRGGGDRGAAAAAPLRRLSADVPRPAPLLRARLRGLALPVVESDRVALPPLRRRSWRAAGRRALAVLPPSGRPDLHLVRHRRRPSGRGPGGGSAQAGFLEPADGLARDRRSGHVPLLSWPRASSLSRPVVGAGAPAAPLPDQVLSPDDALRGAPGGIRGRAPAPDARARGPGCDGGRPRPGPALLRRPSRVGPGRLSRPDDRALAG